MKADAKVSPEARLRQFIAEFEPATQRRIRSIRTALRKRLPTANELAYDYRTFFVIAYAATENAVDAVVAFAARPDGLRLYLMNGPKLPDPKKRLKGAGKQTRYVEVESARSLAHPDVKALIVAALRSAKVPLPAKKRGELVIKTVSAKRQARRGRKK
jgi:hypothetical protein